MNKISRSLYVDVRIEETSERIITFTLSKTPHYFYKNTKKLNLPESSVSHHLTFSLEWT